ncbi:Thiamine monophosphate synthase/TENI [Seminavis robusta]|uniref:Thiamine monophosphate synthase/TENI n=1 Tax=Seminavis robusta TaxID=568900 RepID=A0A9N8F2H1_9STRA|nr:Thiamine monophosphate synthase/TENI [Seminavis robusta]|eukprot:Sro3841_g351380.1 Thiamine monophosphate synthase/TENI (221) ;mRNA; r:1140-1802
MAPFKRALVPSWLLVVALVLTVNLGRSKPSCISCEALSIMMISSSSTNTKASTGSFGSGSFAASKKPPPYLALITPRNTCDNQQRLEDICSKLQEALDTHHVDLVSVRITKATANPKLVLELIQFLVQQSKNNKCSVVVLQDWLDLAIQAEAQGIHIKEGCRGEIPLIRQRYQEANLPPPLIGSTAHSVDSAVEAASFRPDYLFAGSCYFSGDSHPENLY